LESFNGDKLQGLENRTTGMTSKVNRSIIPLITI